MDQSARFSQLPPLCTREVWASAVGLTLDTVNSQCDRGYWPVVKIGRYSLVNVEAIRLKAAERAQEFAL